MLDLRPHSVKPPFAHSSGPRSGAKIAFVGEAFGEQEELVGLPLIGNAGQEFTRLCEEAGINRNECFITNVFAARPPDNKLDAWCISKKECPEGYTAPMLRTGKYVHPQYLGEIERLREELSVVKPNLIVALGGTALWALAGSAAIGTLRGTIAEARLVPGQKLLATYHPSYLFKMWSHRPIVLADLMKAQREAQYPEIRRLSREILVAPTLSEIEWWYNKYAVDAPLLSCDIETKAKQITEFGFATSRRNAIVIPFWNDKAPFSDYWSSAEDECEAWNWVKRFLALPGRKLFQNGLYDLQYAYKMGFRPVNCGEDTMLLHHSYYPEMNKGLGFLGSIYSSEPAWKLMARKKKVEELKRDE